MTRWTRMLVPCLAATALAACGDENTDETPTPEDASPTPVDLISEFPAAPEGGQQWLSPEWIIPAHSEKQFCLVTRYTGENVAIRSAHHYQSQHGHHVLFMSTILDEGDYPDGTMFDCTGKEENSMADLLPIYLTILEGNTSYLEFPDELDNPGVLLRKNTRIVIQSHYVNTSDDDIRVRDAINLEYVDPAEVKTWAAPFANSPINFRLPANQASSYELKCTWEEPVNILFSYGHMHEWGTSITLDWTTEEGTDRLYEVPEWKTEYRDWPVVADYQPLGLEVKAGDVFTTTCNWFNTTDREMVFPEEMCSNAGMAYPSMLPIICSD